MKADKVSYKIFPPYLVYCSLISNIRVFKSIIQMDNKALKEYLKANFVLSKEQLDYFFSEIEMNFKDKRLVHEK